MEAAEAMRLFAQDADGQFWAQFHCSAHNHLYWQPVSEEWLWDQGAFNNAPPELLATLSPRPVSKNHDMTFNKCGFVGFDTVMSIGGNTSVLMRDSFFRNVKHPFMGTGNASVTLDRVTYEAPNRKERRERLREEKKEARQRRLRAA